MAAGDAEDRGEWPNRLLAGMERAADVSVATFAGWTVLSHLFVFVLHGSFSGLRWAGFAVVPLAWAVAKATRDSRRAPREAGDEPSARAEPRFPRVDRALHFLIASAIVLALPLSRSYLPFWCMGLVFLAVVALRSRPSSAALMETPAVTRAQGYGLLALIALSALLTAIAHRPDTDDGFLINVPVWTLDNPYKALYSEDGMHNLPGIPIVFPTYRAHSIELLYAWLAWLLHVEPITVAHVILPPLSSALALICSALLLRALLRRGFLLGAVALVAFWITMGDVHESFANHAYVRIFQGKAVLVSAVLPYIAFAVIRFMASGRRLDWALLLASVITACGLSATGLFSAPLALGAAAAAAWQPTKRHSLRLLAALASAAYAVAVALVLRNQVVDKLGILNGDALYGHVKTFYESLVQVLGNGPYLYLQLVGLLGSCALAADAPRRHFLSALGFVYFALVMNPFLYDSWVKYVTSAPVAWRLYWMAPVPILVAVTLSAAFSGDAERGPGRRERFGFALTVIAAFTSVPAYWSLSAENGVRFGLPGLKVPKGMYALATTVVRLTPKGYSVLAPRELVMWVTTLRGHPRVVAHKENSLKVMEPYMGPEQFALRMHLFVYVSGSGRGEHSAELLASALDRLHIGLVAARRDLPWLAEIEGVMRGAGFTRTEERGYVLFVRSETRSNALSARADRARM